MLYLNVTLLLFWIKIFISRIFILLKSSPVIIIWITIVIGAFIYAVSNNFIALSFDENLLFFIIPFLVLFSILKSFKSFDHLPVLIKYSKSRFNNKTIYSMFFLKQAFINNTILIILLTVIYFIIKKTEYLPVFFVIFALSLTVSFSVMYFKYTHMKIVPLIKPESFKKKSINPLIKSTLHEYLTPDFIVFTALSISLFIIVLADFSLNNLFFEMETQFFIFSSIALSIGFFGIIESVYGIKWMFLTIIFSNDFKFHFKRSAFFLAGIFGLLFIIFILCGIIINPGLMLKFLLCLCVIFSVTINIAITRSNVLIKSIILSANTALTLWIGALHSVFLLILIIPVIVSYIKAKSEFREWTYL